MSTIQFDLFRPTASQVFDDWRKLPGAGRVLELCFATTAGFVGEWRRSGIPVSATLVIELVRHQMKRETFRRCAAADLDGYSLNNVLRPYIARFIMARRPEWRGVFELREVGAARRPARAVVVPIKNRSTP